MSVEERLARVQYRTKQAENSLKQLETCISVINSKKKGAIHDSKGSAQLENLEKENKVLCELVEKLKEKLVKLEYLNGTIPVVVATSQPQQSPPTIQQLENEKVPESGNEKTNTSNGAIGDLKPTDSANGNSKPTCTKEKKKPKEKQPKTQGGAEARPVDVSRLDMRIGRIISVKRHPDADTLYVEEIDVGEEAPRTVCSGLVNFMPIEEMKNRMVVAMCNLKPVKMRGVVSQAMVMCASSPDKVEILDPPNGVIPGDRVTVEGYAGAPDEVLNPKKKIFEQVQPDLRTNEVGVACYKGIPWVVEGKGTMKSQTMTNSIIK